MFVSKRPRQSKIKTYASQIFALNGIKGRRVLACEEPSHAGRSASLKYIEQLFNYSTVSSPYHGSIPHRAKLGEQGAFFHWYSLCQVKSLRPYLIAMSCFSCRCRQVIGATLMTSFKLRKTLSAWRKYNLNCHRREAPKLQQVGS